MRIRIANIQINQCCGHIRNACKGKSKESNKGNACNTICLESVCGGANTVAGIVTGTVSDNTGVLGIVFGSLKTIFMRSEPISAIFVKIPPAILSAEAPRDSPIAKPMKQGPARSFEKNKDADHKEKLNTDKEKTNAHTGFERNIDYPTGFPARDAKAVRAFAFVLILMPNHATP